MRERERERGREGEGEREEFADLPCRLDVNPTCSRTIERRHDAERCTDDRAATS
jgi:hypothetical protein